MTIIYHVVVVDDDDGGDGGGGGGNDNEDDDFDCDYDADSILSKLEWHITELSVVEVESLFNLKTQ